MFILKFTNNIKYLMIPFTTISKSTGSKCHFFHGNGLPPNAYQSFLKAISQNYKIQSMLLRQFWDKNLDPQKIKNWDVFLDDLIQYTNENNIQNEYGIGHSMGGNLLLRSVLKNKKLYKKIVLLDPTIFSPSIIYALKIICFLNLHPLASKAANKRKNFDDFEEIFKSYRTKDVFLKIPDLQLNEYIESIFIKNKNKVELSYNTNWEKIMYLTAGIRDFSIWRNLHKLKTPTLIIIPDNSPVLRYYASKKILKNKFISMERLADSTHFFPMEKPKQTSNLVLDFFSS